MSAVLDSKLRKALELRTDSPQMMDALDSISIFWGDNTLAARRGLRQKLEERNVVLATVSSYPPASPPRFTATLEAAIDRCCIHCSRMPISYLYRGSSTHSLHCSSASTAWRELWGAWRHRAAQSPNA